MIPSSGLRTVFSGGLAEVPISPFWMDQQHWETSKIKATLADGCRAFPSHLQQKLNSTWPPLGQ